MYEHIYIYIYTYIHTNISIHIYNILSSAILKRPAMTPWVNPFQVFNAPWVSSPPPCIMRPPLMTIIGRATLRYLTGIFFIPDLTRFQFSTPPGFLAPPLSCVRL